MMPLQACVEHFVNPGHPFVALRVSANARSQKPGEEGIIAAFHPSTEEETRTYLRLWWR